MNKIWVFSLILISSALTSSAQEFKRFKVGIGAPFAPIASDQFHYYRGLYVEPAWRWNDQWATGLQLSVVGSENQYSEDHLSEDASMLTLAFTTDRYWKLDKVRPFYGLMMGMSSHIHKQTQYNPYFGDPFPEETTSIVNAGYTIAPRIGFNFWHVRTLAMIQITTYTVPNLFILQAGFEIGGGFRKRD